MIQIEPAYDPQRLEDARALFLAYAREFAASIAQTLCFQGFDAEVAGLPGRYAPPSGCLLLAVEGEARAGCVALRDLGAGDCEMKRLYVAPAFRRQGLGRILVAEVIERAQSLGYRRMLLDTVPDMVSAIALYRAFGFVETRAYWDSPFEQTVYMALTLRKEKTGPAGAPGIERRLDPGCQSTESPPGSAP